MQTAAETECELIFRFAYLISSNASNAARCMDPWESTFFIFNLSANWQTIRASDKSISAAAKNIHIQNGHVAIRVNVSAWPQIRLLINWWRPPRNTRFSIHARLCARAREQNRTKETFGPHCALPEKNTKFDRSLSLAQDDAVVDYVKLKIRISITLDTGHEWRQVYRSNDECWLDEGKYVSIETARSSSFARAKKSLINDSFWTWDVRMCAHHAANHCLYLS